MSNYKYPKGLIPMTAGFVKNNPADKTIMGINNDLHGGIKVVRTHAEMLAIPKVYLLKDYSACFVTDNNGEGRPAFYYLTSAPSGTDGTLDQDWTIWSVSGQGDLPGGLKFKGLLDASNIQITDAYAGNKAGDFYVVETTSTQTVTDPSIFGGSTENLNNNDWVIYDDTQGKFTHLNRAVEYIATWANLTGKPQVIKDFVNGIMPTHGHSSTQITLSKTINGTEYTTLNPLLDVILYSNILAADLTSATDANLLNYGQLKEAFSTSESMQNYVDQVIEIFSDNYYIKQEVDTEINTLSQRITQAESNMDLVGEGIIGELNSIAERDTLQGGDAINSFLLSYGDKVIVPDTDGDNKVFVFRGGNGEGGSAFWEFVHVYGDSVEEIKSKYESNSNTNAFTDADETKLSGIEEGAQKSNWEDDSINPTTHIIPKEGKKIPASAVTDLPEGYTSADFNNDLSSKTLDDFNEGGTNKHYTQPEKDKLAGLEISSETAATIKTKYESNPDTNSFTNAYKNKLEAVELTQSTTILTEDFVSAGSNIFTLTNTAELVFNVYLSGVQLSKVDYTVSGTSLTLTDTLASGDEVSITYAYDVNLGLTTDYYTKAESDANVRVQQALVQRTGTVIAFDRPASYGDVTAETGNITFDFTNAISGNTQVLKHNSGTKPTMPASANKLSGDYVVSVDNQIYLTPIFISGSTWRVDVTVSQNNTW